MIEDTIDELEMNVSVAEYTEIRQEYLNLRFPNDETATGIMRACENPNPNELRDEVMGSNLDENKDKKELSILYSKYKSVVDLSLLLSIRRLAEQFVSLKE